jgi:hypothetical protein
MLTMRVQTMSRAWAAAWLLTAVAGAASCQQVKASTPGPEPIALAMPEPPARLLFPVTVEPPPPPPVTPPDKPEPTPVPGKPRPAPPPVTNPPATNPPAETGPPAVVKMSAQAELESLAKDRLAAAQRDLSKIDRRALSPAARDQFDSAQRFIKMTQDALSVRNFPYASYCADKAATLAALLVKG